MSRRASPLSYSLYFVDVLACVLFCITLSLVGASFSRETTVEVELPELAQSGPGLGDTSTVEITLRQGQAGTEFYFADRRLSLSELEAELAEQAPPAVVIRAEETELGRVVALAHASGVRSIELAYEQGSRP